MSCVPSMSAYVATHARQQDDKVTTTQLPQPNDHNSKEKKSFWEWSGLKLIFLGHDGVGLVTSDDAQKGQKKEKSDNLDLWSRVRHFSGSSTTSIEEQTALESPVLDR